MDARVDPLPVLSLEPGDVHVIRNAGGIVTEDVVRSLMISQRMLGTRSIDLMMHTDCGMHGLDEEALRRRVVEESGHTMNLALHAFADLEAELRRGVELLRTTPLLADRSRVRGLIFDVEHQRASVVVP
jgi:carbonic anhydrase